MAQRYSIILRIKILRMYHDALRIIKTNIIVDVHAHVCWKKYHTKLNKYNVILYATN